MVIKQEDTRTGLKENTGNHCCHLYNGRPHLLIALVSLVKMALLQNARCTLSLDPALRREALAVLAAEGFDLSELKRQCRLELLSEPQMVKLYRCGVTELERLYRLWDELLQEAGLTAQLLIGQAEAAAKAAGWEAFLRYESEVGLFLKNCRMNLICLYPFAQTCMGPHYKTIRDAHPRLLNGGGILDIQTTKIGQTA